MLLQLIIRIIGRSRKHSFRSILGFALVISMIVATSGVILGFSSEITWITKKSGESQTIIIQAKDTKSGIPHQIIPLIQHTNIKKILPVIEKNIILYSSSKSINTVLTVLNISSLMDFYPQAYVYAGRLPQSNTSYQECLVGKDLYQHLFSSEINITDNSGLKSEFYVVGLIQNVKEFQGSILVDLIEYSRMINQSITQNKYQKIKIELRNNQFSKETILELEELLVNYRDYITIKQEQQTDFFTQRLFSDIIAKLNLLYGALFLIALIRIFHTISWFIQKYERDILIMKSMGLSPLQIAFLVLALAAIIGNSGFIIGVYFGLLIPSLLFTVLSMILTRGFLVPIFSLPTLISLFFISNLVVLIATIYPLIKIVSKSPSILSISVHSFDK